MHIYKVINIHEATSACEACGLGNEMDPHLCNSVSWIAFKITAFV